MPDEEILENEATDSLQDDPGFELNIASSNVVQIEDDSATVYEPLYIDRIRFSDGVYLIRDSELREIMQVYIRRINELESKVNELMGGQ